MKNKNGLSPKCRKKLIALISIVSIIFVLALYICLK